jgi:hypothetical protein
MTSSRNGYSNRIEASVDSDPHEKRTGEVLHLAHDDRLGDESGHLHRRPDVDLAVGEQPVEAGRAGEALVAGATGG